MTMEPEIQIEPAQSEPLEAKNGGITWDKLTLTAVKVLSPDEMAGLKWWLEDWFLEWKGLAEIRNDTDFEARSKRGKQLKYSG